MSRVAEALGHAIEFGDELAGALAGIERELDAAEALAPQRTLAAQRLEPAHAAFVARAARFDALADPRLLLAPELVELARGRRFGGELGRLAAVVGGEVARIRAQQPAVELDDPRANAVEKYAIVRDDDRRACRLHVSFRAVRCRRRRDDSSARRAAADRARAPVQVPVQRACARHPTCACGSCASSRPKRCRYSDSRASTRQRSRSSAIRATVAALREAFAQRRRWWQRRLLLDERRRERPPRRSMTPSSSAILPGNRAAAATTSRSRCARSGRRARSRRSRSRRDRAADAVRTRAPRRELSPGPSGKDSATGRNARSPRTRALAATLKMTASQTCAGFFHDVADRRSSRVSRSPFRRPRGTAVARTPGRAPWGKTVERAVLARLARGLRADHLGLRPGARNPVIVSHRPCWTRHAAALLTIIAFVLDRRGVCAANEDQGGARPSDDGGCRAVGVRSPAREWAAARRRAVRRLPRLGHRHVRHPTRPRPGRPARRIRPARLAKDAIAIVAGVVVSVGFALFLHGPLIGVRPFG